MAEGSELRIRGAASRSSISEQSSSGSQDQSGLSTENLSKQAENAEQAQDGASYSDVAKQSQNGDEDMALKELQEKYKWYKCALPTDNPAYGEHTHYYIHSARPSDTTWEEPDEPYWLWDAVLQGPDMKIGLIKTKQRPSRAEMLSIEHPKVEEYQGYNPKIHGNYDPNADYAKYHQQMRDGERYIKDQETFATAAGQGDYAATMSLNRWSGKAQQGDFGPERHTDAAKSSRQLNAFFDVDGAANQHGGRSLKAERRNTKLSKAETQKLNEERKKKKEQKRRNFYLS